MNEIKSDAFVFSTLLKISLFSLFLFFSFKNPCCAQLAALPTVDRFVVDQTQTLSHSEIEALNNKLASFEKEKGSQVVVVFVPTTAPEEIEQYSIRLADEIKGGRKNIDDGLIILVAKDDRRMRIEVGYGLEGAIPDIYAKRIIENIMKPEFRNGDFYDGVDQAVDVVFGLIQGEELPLPDGSESMEQHVLFQFMPFLFILGIILFTVLKRVLVKTFGKKYTGIGMFILTTIIVGLLINFIVGIFAGVMVSLFAIGGGGGHRGGGYYGGIGGFGGGGFSGGGGFGGFSGGGGGFGGGGASGGW